MTDDFKHDQKPPSKHPALQCQTKEVPPKSYAQVETLVLPQAVLPKSGGLKPEMSNRYRHPQMQKKSAKRQAPLSVRLSDKDRAIIAQKAFNIGYSVNAYMIAAALGSDYKPPIGRDMVMALLTVKRELTAQGRNLNQIAHSHNSNIHTEAETNSMLGIIARPMLKALDAVDAALSWGKTYPDK